MAIAPAMLIWRPEVETRVDIDDNDDDDDVIREAVMWVHPSAEVETREALSDAATERLRRSKKKKYVEIISVIPVKMTLRFLKRYLQERSRIIPPAKMESNGPTV